MSWGLSDVTDSIAALVGSLAKPGAYVSQLAADRAYRDKLPGPVAPAPAGGLPGWVIPLAIGGLAAVAIVAYSSSKKPQRRRKR